MLVALVSLSLIATVGYLLFIRGWLFALFIIAAGIIGGRLIILSAWPEASATIMTFAGHDISWATFMAALFTICGITFFSDKYDDI